MQFIRVQVDGRCPDGFVTTSIYVEAIQNIPGHLFPIPSQASCWPKHLASNHTGHSGTPGAHAASTSKRPSVLLAFDWDHPVWRLHVGYSDGTWDIVEPSANALGITNFMILFQLRVLA